MRIRQNVGCSGSNPKIIRVLAVFPAKVITGSLGCRIVAAFFIWLIACELEYAWPRKKNKQVLRTSVNIYLVHYASDTLLSTRYSSELIISRNTLCTWSQSTSLITSAVINAFHAVLSWYCLAIIVEGDTILFEDKTLLGYINFLQCNKMIWKHCFLSVFS